MASTAADVTTFVIPICEQDLSVISDLEQFRNGIQRRLGYDIAVILVSKDGIPLAPPMDAHEIPLAAIWLPTMGS